MASHEELIAEMPKLEKLSNAARLSRAKKRRQKQLKKFQEWIRLDRQTTGSLLKRRTPVELRIEEGALLNDLVARNDIIGVQKLLQKGVDPNISNADGLTPLHKCCIDNTVELAEILLEHGADLNARDIEGWTPLHAASATGNVQMINILIEEGASLVAINHDDSLPVDVAKDSDIRYILQQKMIEAGYTDDVLEYIHASVPKTMLADLKDSVKNNRTLNIKDKYGATALHVAAANGYTEVLDFLLDQSDTDLDIQDSEGWTPFHAAVCWGQRDVMQKLAEKGADMDIRNLHGETAYAIAEDPDIRQYILELKGEFSQSQEVQIEEQVAVFKKPRRMSVKRIPQEEKEKLTKQSVQDEAFTRRQSLAQQDNERHSLIERSDSAALESELPVDDTESGAVLTRFTSQSSEMTPEPESHEQERNTVCNAAFGGSDDSHTGGEITGESRDQKLRSESPEDNDKEDKKEKPVVKKERFTIQDRAYDNKKAPRKSVLKKRPGVAPPVTNSYAAEPSSPSVSPTGSEPRRQDQTCCTIL